MRKTTDQAPEHQRGLLSLRQGDIVEMPANGLADQLSARDLVIVVSHDCDNYAAAAKEPHIEVIPVLVATKTDSRMTHAKSSRTLYLAAIREPGGEITPIRIDAINKLRIGKMALRERKMAHPYKLDSANLGILVDWLSLRYRRAALPNEFAERFETIKEQFWAIIAKLNYQISGVLLLFEEGQERLALPPEVPYVISILLVYPEQERDPLLDGIPEDVRELFEASFCQDVDEGQGGIEIKGCAWISEHALTLSQYKIAIQLGSEGISLESEPPGPTINL
jgi:hypothetical protein